MRTRLMRTFFPAAFYLMFFTPLVFAQVDFDHSGFNFGHYIAVADHTAVVLPKPWPVALPVTAPVAEDWAMTA